MTSSPAQLKKNSQKRLRGNSNQAGFTIVELLIVTLLSVMLMMAVSTIFMTFMLNGAKLSIEQTIKSEGSHAIDQISTILRNSRRLESTCTTNMNSILIQNFDDQSIQIYSVATENGSRIAVRNQTTSSTKYLTSVDSQTTPSLTFNCYQGANSTFINFNFGLKRGPGITPDRDTAIIDFAGSVEMRNR